MIEGDASAGGYTHILPGRWTPRSVGRACKCICVCVHVCRSLTRKREGITEPRRWPWRGREERRKKEERGMQPEGL